MSDVSSSVVKGTAKTKTTGTRRTIRRVMGCLGIAVGTALALCVVALILVFHAPPAPVIHIDPAAAQRLEARVQQAQTAAAAGAPGVVRADETELNSMLDSYFRSVTGGPSENTAAVVRDLKFKLFEDRMRVYVIATVQGKDITVVIDGKVHTVNGYLDFEPLSGKIGALPMPKTSLKRAVEQMAASPDTRGFMRLPNNLHDLYVEDGKVVVVYM
jgi:hypothetical protein